MKEKGSIPENIVQGFNRVTAIISSMHIDHEADNRNGETEYNSESDNEEDETENEETIQDEEGFEFQVNSPLSAERHVR